MQAIGYIQVNAFASRARIPLKDTAIVVTATDGTAIAMRLTNRSGQIAPIAIPVPDMAESQTPDPDQTPFTVVNLYARKPGYEQVEAENLQVFPGTTTVQNLELVPLSELPEDWGQTILFDTPPQNL